MCLTEFVLSANFVKYFFIITVDKCIVLLHSVWCVTVNVAVRLFQLLPSAECCHVVSAGGRQAINASSPARTLRSVAEREQLGVMVRGN